MITMIDIFHGISLPTKDYKRGWCAHQWAKLKRIHPDLVVDNHNKKIDEADTIFIDPGIDFMLTGNFEAFGGFTPEHYTTIQKLRNKNVYWIGRNCNEELNYVLRSFNAKNYAYRRILPQKLNLTPLNFKTYSFKLSSVIFGNINTMAFARVTDRIIINTDPLAAHLKEGLMYEDATYCLGMGEKDLSLDLVEEYIKQVADLNGSVCEFLPFTGVDFSDKMLALADDYMVPVIHVPDYYRRTVKMAWEACMLDRYGYLLPQHYNICNGSFK